MQTSINYRSKSAHNKLNSLLSIQTATFLDSYQFLDHQTLTPFWKTQIPHTTIKLTQKNTLQPSKPPNHHQEPQQNRRLAKTKTAINELQQLMTPRSQNLTSFGKIIDNVKMINSIMPQTSDIKENEQLHAQRQRLNQEKLKFKEINRFQYYQAQLKKVNGLLQKEENKQRQSLSNIAFLQNKLCQLHQEKSDTDHLFRKLQNQYSQLQKKHKQLEQKLRQRVIVNLQLEALMVSLKMKNDQKLQELKNVIKTLQTALNEKDSHYDALIKKMQQEFQSSKKTGQQQINSLITQLNKRSIQLSDLKAKQKISIFDSEPIFDKFGISTKNSNYFIQPSLKSQQKQNSKHNQIAKHQIPLNELVTQQQQTKEKAESPEPKLRFQSLHLQNYSFGKNRPFCKSDRL